jgi:hypothetical protein
VSHSSLTYHSTERGADTVRQNLIGENECQAVLQRLDRLAQDEVRLTAAQTLQVVYELVQNKKMLMDGKQILFSFPLGIP